MSWTIESLDITSGFLGDLSLSLPKGPGLVCVIGPRGSGKSTLIEALRFVFCGASNASRARQELLQANLGNSVLSVRTEGDKPSTGYAITRRFKQPPSLTTREGQPVSNVDLDRGTFLPLDAYSSHEIESIADESVGEKRRALIDELQGPDYRALVHALAARRRDLDGNADAIRLATQKRHDLIERIEELGDAKARLDALPVPPENGDSKGLAEALTQHQLNAREQTFLRGLVTALVEISRALQQSLDAKSSDLPAGKTKNAKLLVEARQVYTETIEAAKRTLMDLRVRIEESVASLRAHESGLLKVHAEQEQHYRKLEALNQGASKALAEHTAALQTVGTLRELEKQRKQLGRDLEQLRAQRNQLRADYLLQRESVSKSREAIAAALQGAAGQRVRVRVLRNGDNLAYSQMLLEGLRGARVRNHEDILDALLQLRPEMLAAIIDANDVGELEAHASFGVERSRRILEAFQGNLDPYSLEIVDIEDKIALELNVGSEAEPMFKDAAELSRGQKCTALLPLLLARRDTPLLIDQPEDNLDNHFIYETVVEAVRRLKRSRQMIFVTHNANIPVLGEADLVVVMSSDGRRGYIARQGTLEDCKKEIIDLLEGGREAFELRRKRYDRK